MAFDFSKANPDFVFLLKNLKNHGRYWLSSLKSKNYLNLYSEEGDNEQ